MKSHQGRNEDRKKVINMAKKLFYLDIAMKNCTEMIQIRTYLSSW